MKKSTNTSSSFDSIVYVLSHATNMQLFWSLLGANDVLPRVSIFNDNNNNNNIEIIWDVQFTCLDDLDYDTWPNVNIPRGIIINLK
jgi:hypothetical protein